MKAHRREVITVHTEDTTELVSDQFSRAARHILEIGRAERPVTVTVGLGRMLLLAFEGSDGPGQRIHMRSWGLEAVAMRRTSSHGRDDDIRAVDGDPNGYIDLLAYVAEFDDPHIDRGVTWIRSQASQRETPLIIMSATAQPETTVAALTDSLELATLRSRQFVDALLEDEPLIPYARYSARSALLLQQSHAITPWYQKDLPQ